MWTVSRQWMIKFDFILRHHLMPESKEGLTNKIMIGLYQRDTEPTTRTPDRQSNKNYTSKRNRTILDLTQIIK